MTKSAFTKEKRQICIIYLEIHISFEIMEKSEVKKI